MKALLEAGADPNAGEVEPGKGYTPLHYAVLAGGNRFFIATLLDAGADPNARDRLGKTPVDVARKQKNAAVLAALKQPPRREQNPLDQGRKRGKGPRVPLAPPPSAPPGIPRSSLRRRRLKS